MPGKTLATPAAASAKNNLAQKKQIIQEPLLTAAASALVGGELMLTQAFERFPVEARFVKNLLLLVPQALQAGEFLFDDAPLFHKRRFACRREAQFRDGLASL